MNYGSPTYFVAFYVERWKWYFTFRAWRIHLLTSNVIGTNVYRGSVRQ